MHPIDEGDELVRGQLRASSPAGGLSPEALERLAGRIVGQAGPVLLRHGRRARWRVEVVRAGRIAGPLALAAGIAALLLIARTDPGGGSSATPVSTFLAVLSGEVTADSLLDETLGPAGGAWMFAAEDR